MAKRSVWSVAPRPKLGQFGAEEVVNAKPIRVAAERGCDVDAERAYDVSTMRPRAEPRPNETWSAIQ